MDKEERAFYEKLEGKGVSRRDFMKFCTFLTATMGLSSSFIPKVAEVFAAPAQRPPVIWLHLGRMHGMHRGRDPVHVSLDRPAGARGARRRLP